MNKEMLGESWYPVMLPELQKDYFETLKEELRKEYFEYKVCPEPQNIFKAFQLTPFENVKVVMVGQDPYPYNDDANGLAFSSNNTITPFSLRVIFRELDRDVLKTQTFTEYRKLIPNNDLTPWAKQGVFLINTVLTVRGGQANSHSKLGWQEFTHKVINNLWMNPAPKVFMAWGSEAQNVFKDLVEDESSGDSHLLLETGHPASGAHGKDKFSGCNHFSKANHWLQKHGIEPIEWSLNGNG